MLSRCLNFPSVTCCSHQPTPSSDFCISQNKHSTIPMNSGYILSKNVSSRIILCSRKCRRVSWSRCSGLTASYRFFNFMFEIKSLQPFATVSRLYKSDILRSFITVSFSIRSLLTKLMQASKTCLTWYSSLSLRRCSTFSTINEHKNYVRIFVE